LQATQKQFRKLSFQPGLRGSNDLRSASDEKCRQFNCFFQSGRAKDLSAPLYLKLYLRPKFATHIEHPLRYKE